MSNSLQPHGLQPARLLCPWDFPGKKIGVRRHFLLRGIFLTQGFNLCGLHWQADSLSLSHLASLYLLKKEKSVLLQVDNSRVLLGKCWIQIHRAEGAGQDKLANELPLDRSAYSPWDG